MSDEDKSSKTYKILLIEDDEQNIQNALEAFKDHEVLVAKTLQEAEEILDKHYPDFIISDLNFPTKLGEQPTNQEENILKLLEKRKTVCLVLTGGVYHHDKKGIKIMLYSPYVSTPLELKLLYGDKKTPEIYRKSIDLLEQNVHFEEIVNAIKRYRKFVGG